MGTIVKTLPPNDVVNSPRHYLCTYPLSIVYRDEKTGEMYIDALAVIKAWGFEVNAYLFNILKYLLRGGKKADNSYLQELKKSRFYLDEEIAKVEKLVADGMTATIEGGVKKHDDS